MSRERWLAIEAHADDVAWTTAGNVALKTQSGHQVDSVLLTDSSGQGIGKQRLLEQVQMMRVLGMTDLYPVGDEQEFIDGTLSHINLQTIAQALFHIIDIAEDEGKPYWGISTFNQRGFSGHPDHSKTAEAAEYVFAHRPNIKQLMQVEMTPEEYALWPKDYFVEVPVPDITGCIPINISGTRNLKIEAIRTHTSQLTNGGYDQIARVQQLPPREIYRYTNRV